MPKMQAIVSASAMLKANAFACNAVCTRKMTVLPSVTTNAEYTPPRTTHIRGGVGLLRPSNNTIAVVASTTPSTTSTAMSCTSVIACCVLTIAATVTKAATPSTQIDIDLTTLFAGAFFANSDVAMTVNTIETTPMGCTTISGANVRLPICSTIEASNSTPPINQE